MNRRDESRARAYSSQARFLTMSVLGSALLVSTGCAARTLSVTQDDYVNNAMHHYRPPEQRTGEPLEVTVVCVYPGNLERDENAGLKPGSGVTCKDWYDHKPVRGGDGGRFTIPPEQIYLLTNSAQVYGKKKGPALNGAINDGRSQIEVKGIAFKAVKAFSRDSVIYVFPKFIGPDGAVLPARPAEFKSPGAFSRKMSVKIGVEEGRGEQGQYIEKCD